MSHATTERKERKPLPRTCNITTRPDGLFLLELTLQKSKKATQTDYYIGHQITAGFGVGFRLEKQDVENLDNEQPVEVYHVNLHGLDGNHFCDCRGAGSVKPRAGKPGECKHVAALSALIAAGKLTPKPSEQQMERIAEEAESIDTADELLDLDEMLAASHADEARLRRDWADAEAEWDRMQSAEAEADAYHSQWD